MNRCVNPLDVNIFAKPRTGMSVSETYSGIPQKHASTEAMVFTIDVGLTFWKLDNFEANVSE